MIGQLTGTLSALVFQLIILHSTNNLRPLLSSMDSGLAVIRLNRFRQYSSELLVPQQKCYFVPRILLKKEKHSILTNLQSTSKHGAIEDLEITTFQDHEFKMTAYIESKACQGHLTRVAVSERKPGRLCVKLMRNISEFTGNVQWSAILRNNFIRFIVLVSVRDIVRPCTITTPFGLSQSAEKTPSRQLHPFEARLSADPRSLWSRGHRSL